jgi:hypothetical protein
MSYIINLPNGQTLGTVLDGTINNTATSLTLVGRNYSGYGQIIQNDLVALLVNFAYSVSPSNPNTGQIWYDTGSSVAKIWTGSVWKIVGSCTSQSGAPTTTIAGDLWWDSADKQLYVYDGTTPYPGFPASTGWILVGPGYSVVDGKSTAIRETINNGSTDIPVTSLYLDGVRTAIISATNFTPATPITGFANIRIGHNISSVYPIYGTAENANNLGGQQAANYFRNNINNSGTGTLSIVNDSGLTIGAFGQFVANISSNNVSLQNTVSGSLRLVNQGNVALTVTAAGQITVNTDPAVALGVATKQYVDNSFINANLWGVSTAVTAPALTANTMIATTEFVRNNSGFYAYKIYDGATHMWVDSTSANIVINGTIVATASASGFNLFNGATAVTQGQTYATSGNTLVATTQFVKTATTWWGGSAKFVSNAAPNPGVNDIGSNDGDFWFQYAN